MARTISAIDEAGDKGKWDDGKEKKADKLIEAEKSETGKVISLFHLNHSTVYYHMTLHLGVF